MMITFMLLPAHAETSPCEDLTLPGLPEVLVDESCETEARVGSFDPVVEWQWTEEGTMTTPMVANVTDDNKDGRIDEGDTPDICLLYTSPSPRD